jgi:hypothetical protein
MQITGNANAYYRYARRFNDRDKVIFLIFENNQHLMASFSKVVDRRNIDEDTRNIVNIKKNEIIPPSAKNEIPKIIVDLNRLTTISTPVRAIKSKNEHNANNG